MHAVWMGRTMATVYFCHQIKLKQKQLSIAQERERERGGEREREREDPQEKTFLCLKFFKFVKFSKTNLQSSTSNKIIQQIFPKLKCKIEGCECVSVCGSCKLKLKLYFSYKRQLLHLGSRVVMTLTSASSIQVSDIEYYYLYFLNSFYLIICSHLPSWRITDISHEEKLKVSRTNFTSVLIRVF